MSRNSKVVWSEGMLLQPQHLQQHDRYLQVQLEARVSGLQPYGWGFTSIRIDEQQLALGKVALLACTGVLPDGTPVSLPEDDALPLPLEIPATARGMLVVLALPLRRPGVPETSDAAGQENFARHRQAELEVDDSNGLDSTASVSIGQLRLRLAPESEVAHAYANLGIAQVIERRADNTVVLDRDYCPPCLNFRASARLGIYADELVGMLQQRGEALAARLSQPDMGGAAEVADFLLLQLINRSQPMFAHLASMTGLHPERLYREAVQLAGELATFTHPDKRARRYPVYRHDALAETFFPVMQDLRKSLSAVMDPHAVPIRLEDRQYGFRVGVVADTELIRSATFVLAVNAQMPAEAIRTDFPPQAKIAPVEKIVQLVKGALPGMPLRPLPVAPRQLPFHAGFTYFEIERGGDYWRQMETSAGFGMHVAGNFPGLQMEFWAIRK